MNTTYHRFYKRQKKWRKQLNINFREPRVPSKG